MTRESMDQPKKPWWRKRRQAVAGLLWLAMAYELSFGPAVYCHERGWLSGRTLHAAYPETIPDAVGEAVGLWSYNRWWADLGRRHAAP